MGVLRDSEPVVSTSALVLEAYEKATWRDVRAIIAETFQPVESLDDENNNDDVTFGINGGRRRILGFIRIRADRCHESRERS